MSPAVQPVAISGTPNAHGAGDDAIQHLFDLTAAISASSTPGEVYAAALRCLGQVLGIARSAILLADAAGTLRFHAWQGISDEYRLAVDGHSPWIPADSDPQPVLVPDTEHDDSLDLYRAALRSERIRAMAFIPLVGRSGLFGKFMLYYDDPHEFTDREVLAARTIAAQVAFAIEQDRAATQRREASHLLTARERTINAMFRSPVVGVAEITPEGQFLTVNDRFCELAGRSREELTNGLDCIVITHAEDQRATRDCLQSLSDGAEHFTFEKRYVRPDGTTAWVAKSVSAIRDTPGGALRGAIAVATDVTERKVQEDNIRISEARYRSLIESLGVAVYTTDATGRITLFNREAELLWGRRPEPDEYWCGSWRIYDPATGDEISHDSCPMAIAVREMRPVRGIEILVERPDGSRAQILPYPTPLTDFFGRLTGAVNVLVDITALKQTQAELRDALRAKDDFLGQISHELKNPVTQIGGYADLLVRRHDLSEADTIDALQEIRSQSARVQRLIENMLVLSRVERGVMPGTEPHLLQRVILQPLAEFRQRFPQTEVREEISSDLPPVESSASTIDQVTWNLLTNAQKYGPPSGPIVVRAWATDAEVSVSVRDYGPGIPADELQRLAEPYFRSSNTAAHAAGLGLGLSVCRRLLTAQNGRLWARRAEGGGMEFGFSLPALTVRE